MPLWFRFVHSQSQSFTSSFPMRCSLLSLAFIAGTTATTFHRAAYNETSLQEETRSLDEIHQAALAEGGIVTLWHGGDEKTQQNFLKTAFEVD